MKRLNEGKTMVVDIHYGSFEDEVLVMRDSILIFEYGEEIFKPMRPISLALYQIRRNF